MNGIYLKSEQLSFLQWRKDNVNYLLNNYVPFLLNKLNTKYSEIKSYEYHDLTNEMTSDGYRFTNIKVLKITLETIGGTITTSVKLPIPSDEDIFIMNRKPYILVNLLADSLFYFYMRDIYTISFRIFKDGKWRPYKGSQVKNQKAIPIFKVLHALELLDDWFPNYTIDNHNIPNSFSFEMVDGIFFNSDKVDVITSTHQLIIDSLKGDTTKDIDSIDSADIISKIEQQNPFDYSYEYEFVKGYSDLKSLYSDIMTHYANDKYHKFDEIHTDFKRVIYYEQVLKILASRIKNIKDRFAKAKNLTNDINWSQRIPANCMTKAMKKYKYMQYLDPNPFIEISAKYKLVIDLENIPLYMRNTSMTAYGKICPLDSPDNNHIGQIQALVSNVSLDKFGQFRTDIKTIDLKN